MTTPNQNDRLRRRKKRIGHIRLAVCVLLLAAAVWGVCLLIGRLRTSGEETETAPPAQETSQRTQPEKTPLAEVEQPAAEEQPTAEEQPADPAQWIQDAARQNATGEQPRLTEYADWTQNARTILEGLCADPYYADYGFQLAAQPGYPYLLAVNRAASTVTVYAADEAGNYTQPFMAMVCSGGADTPLGYWNTPVSYDWRLLAGPCYGQYATRIWDCFLFHSVPYYTQHQDDIEYDQFNQLGTLASLGCIRLEVVDVKWIYDNCPIGTPVIIYDDPENPGPMGKPGTIYTDPTDTALRGWDPTDPNPENPWPESFRTGTAIRSEAAWQQWNESTPMWQQTVNPTDLQGFSTDSGVEGTRG